MLAKRRLLSLLLAILTVLLCWIASPGTATLPPGPSVTQTTPDHPSAGQILEQQGKAFYDAEQFQEAAAVLQEAAQVYEASGETLHQAVVLGNLALTYQHLGQWEDANQAIATCLSLLRSVSEPHLSGQQRVALAQAFNIQGGLLFAQGQPQQAFTTWQQAIEIYDQLGDEVGSLRNQINQAQALQAMGQYQRAVEILTAVQGALQTQPDSSIVVVALRNLGDALQVAGDLDESRQVLQQSLAIAQRLQLPEAIASAQFSLGNLARTQQDTETALEFYRQAARNSPSAIDRLQARLNEFSLLIDTQQWAEAQRLWPSFWDEIDPLPLSRAAIEARINLVQSLHRLKQATGIETPTWDTLVQQVSIAQDQAETLGDVRSWAYALGILGQIYEQTQSWETAEAFTRQALQIAQSGQTKDRTYFWQWQLGRILKHQGRRLEALDAYNSAFTTLQALRRDVVTTNASYQLRFRNQAEDPVYREYIDLLLQAEVPSQNDLQRSREVLTSLQVAELENFLQVPCLETTPALTDHVIDNQDPTAAVIYPVLLGDRLEVIARLPNDPVLYHHRNPETPATQVQQLLKQLQLDLEREYTFVAVKSESQQLYQWLIQPLEERLTQAHVKTLVFVLTGSLRNSSMAALYDGTDYLIKRYAIAIVPGAEVVDSKPLLREEIRVLGASLTEPPEAFNRDFAQLSYVDTELDQIQQAGLPLTPLRNTQFTRSAFNSTLTRSTFQIVHLATHGQFSSSPHETFVLASDGEIRVSNLRNVFRTRGQVRPDAIELLVLSACETAVGDELATLGIAGTAVRAGVRSTIAALWSLDDASSVEFAGQFYRFIGQPHVNRAEALRRAQQLLLESSQYKHPRYWAGYVLVGNWL